MRANNWVWIAIAMLVLGLSTNNIYADSTGATSPTVAATSPASINDFILRTNAFSSDNSYAIGQNNDDQAYGTFGFDLSVPDGSTINGITVTLEGRRSSALCGAIIGDPQFSVQLSDPTLVGNPTGLGSFTGDVKTTPDYTNTVFGADQTKILGGSTDTWSNAYTNLDNFWILVTSECGTIITSMLLDHVTVEVDYTIQSGGGGDDNVWDTRPTFGMNPENQDQLVVQCGFKMDQTCFDLTDIWHTPFDKIVISTGETHNYQLNILAQHRLKDAGFCLVPAVGSMEGELCIGVSLDGNGNMIDTTIKQKEGLVDESLITFSATRDGAFYNIIINGVKFLDQPFYEVIGLYAVDYQPLVTNQFLNEGIDVQGQIFVEQPVIKIASEKKSKYGEDGSITLIRFNKFENLWFGSDGIVYTFNDFGTPLKVTDEKFVRPTDEYQSAMTRTNSNFQLIKDYTADQAEQKMREMYPSMFKEVEFSELGNIVSHNEPYINHKKLLAEKLFD